MLGPYQVLAKLGEGGMGEVYRATDRNLKRSVAIKVLPASVAGDADRLGRFQREAEVLAALNHPNIGAVYGLEKTPDVTALVMELVEGDDLSQRIARGPIPLDEALPIARQIAGALEAAHEQHIIHRDLKPANIKVRNDGTVKVLDFGLAKALAPEGASSKSASVSMSPTITTPAMTQAGMILGTAAYMSPEQAKGRAVDKRSDVWAFGAVLYEMLTGKRAFEGEDVSETLAGILMKEPDWTAVPATVPAAVATVMRRCLQKDRKQRLRDLGDAALALDGAFETGPPAPAPVPGTSRGARLAWIVAAAAVLAAAALVVPALRHLRETPLPETRSLRVSVVHTEGSEVAAPAISPDGRRVAYRARRGDGLPLLWVRDLASGESQSLPGTEDAAMPFWSPDSRDLGFFAGVTLKRVSAAGGPVRVVTDNIGTFGGAGGAWGADGTIVFSGQFLLLRVQAEGGAATELTKAPSQDWAHFWPSFLPDGRRFLFTAKLWTRAAEASEQGIYLGSLDSPTIQRLLPDLSSAVYAPPGYLVFVREGTLTAAPFDLAAGRVTGPPVAIGGAVATEAQFYFAAISASADGTIALRPPPAVAPINADMNASDAELRLVDRGGTGSRVGAARLFSSSSFMALSPVNSRTLAAAILDRRAGTQDLWLMDLTKDSITPLTATRGFAANPVWSTDGRRLAYAYQPPGQLDDVHIKDIGTGVTQPVIETPRTLEHPAAWSHDEQSLLVFTDDDKGTYLSWWSFASRTLTRFVGPRVLDGAAFFTPRRFRGFHVT